MYDEAGLIEEARRDPAAFAHLYDRYVDRIYAYIRRETGDTKASQDILSSVFEKAMRNLPRYEQRGYSFGAWLFKIARNEILMTRRREWRFLPLLDRLRSRDSVEKTVEMNDERSAVRQAMNRLSRRDQEIIRLRYYEDLSNLEISHMLSCSNRQVAVRLHRALKRLRQHLAVDAKELVPDVSS